MTARCTSSITPVCGRPKTSNQHPHWNFSYPIELEIRRGGRGGGRGWEGVKGEKEERGAGAKEKTSTYQDYRPSVSRRNISKRIAIGRRIGCYKSSKLLAFLLFCFCFAKSPIKLCDVHTRWGTEVHWDTEVLRDFATLVMRREECSINRK